MSSLRQQHLILPTGCSYNEVCLHPIPYMNSKCGSMRRTDSPPPPTTMGFGEEGNEERLVLEYEVLILDIFSLGPGV